MKFHVTSAVLLVSTFALAAVAGCSSTPAGGGVAGTCSAPAPTHRLSLNKKDGNCENGLFARSIGTSENNGCTVKQASPGSCDATFTCESKSADEAESYSGSLTLTADGTGTGKATVTITTAAGAPKCKGTYDATVSKE